MRGDSIQNVQFLSGSVTNPASVKGYSRSGDLPLNTLLFN